MTICIITGTRAEYGLLSPLLHALRTADDFRLQLVVTGAHLSPEFGETWREIERDGFPIEEKVEMLLSSDTPTGIAKSVGLGIIGLTDALARLKPDWVVLLGDRYEALAAATAAYLQRIPIAHLHGGETTEGALDEGLRHAITKLSYLHFTATEGYRRRVIQLGEAPERVFNVGAIGLDNIQRLPLLDRPRLADELHIDPTQPFALVAFHPVTLGEEPTETQFQAVLDALSEHTELTLIFTYPNADQHGRVLIERIEEFAARESDRTRVFANLGQLRNLSAMQHAAFLLGNSSSGLIETPSFGVPTINVGDRQRGRERGASVIDVPPTRDAISAAIDRALSDDFREQCRAAANPYGDGRTTARIVEVLRRFGRVGDVRKGFYDVVGGSVSFAAP